MQGAPRASLRPRTADIPRVRNVISIWSACALAFGVLLITSVPNLEEGSNLSTASLRNYPGVGRYAPSRLGAPRRSISRPGAPLIGRRRPSVCVRSTDPEGGSNEDGAPELRNWVELPDGRFQGKVFNRQGLAEGKVIATSSARRISRTQIRTDTGKVYTLEPPYPEKEEEEKKEEEVEVVEKQEGEEAADYDPFKAWIKSLGEKENRKREKANEEATETAVVQTGSSSMKVTTTTTTAEDKDKTVITANVVIDSDTPASDVSIEMAQLPDTDPQMESSSNPTEKSHSQPLVAEPETEVQSAEVLSSAAKVPEPDVAKADVEEEVVEASRLAKQPEVAAQQAAVQEVEDAPAPAPAAYPVPSAFDKYDNEGKPSGPALKFVEAMGWKVEEDKPPAETTNVAKGAIQPAESEVAVVQKRKEEEEELNALLPTEDVREESFAADKLMTKELASTVSKTETQLAKKGTGWLTGLLAKGAATLVNSPVNVNNQFNTVVQYNFGDGKQRDLAQCKSELLVAISDVDRGLRATRDQRDKIEQLIRAMEAGNPTKTPLKNPLLNGRWALLYTTATGVLGDGNLVRPTGPIYQSVDIFGLRILNEQAYEPIPFVRWTTSAAGDLMPKSNSRAEVKFEQFRVGGLKVVAPPTDPARKMIEWELEVSGKGTPAWIDNTYVDENMRVVRDHKGNVFVMKRDDP